jgi:hypothetical protein
MVGSGSCQLPPMAGVFVRSTHDGIEDPIGLTPLPRDAGQVSDRGADAAAPARCRLC